MQVSLPPFAHDCTHPVFFFFPFRIAIWNRKIFVSLFAVGLWLAGIALHIYSMCHALQLWAPFSHLLCLHLRRLDNGTTFVWVLLEILDSSTHNLKVRSVVHCSFRGLYHFGFAEVVGQRCRHAGDRHTAPHEHADWVPAICAQKFDWNMFPSLPAGSTLPFIVSYVGC